MTVKYVHEILPGVYIGVGTKNPTSNLNEAALYNYPKSAKQTSAWWHLGGKILPVQVSVAVSGEPTDTAEPNSDWWIDEIKAKFGIK